MEVVVEEEEEEEVGFWGWRNERPVIGPRVGW